MQSRDQVQHDAIAADMLYTAIFGPQPPTHPEYKALFSGMEFYCRSGFTMHEVSRSNYCARCLLIQMCSFSDHIPVELSVF